MCCERKEFEIFSCVRGKRLGKKQKEEKKSRLEEQKEEKKSSFLRAKKKQKTKSIKKKSEKRKERDTRIFFQRHKFSSFFALLALEKIHHFERRLRTQRRLYEDSLRRESVEEEREMSSSDENSATADRVEKKSIDEAIASFAMLVRIECVFILYVFVCFYVRVRGEED